MPSTATDRLSGLSTSLAMKAPCRVATTAAITLSGTQTIDGVAVVARDRVLVKNQATTTENGIYIAGSGAWSRAADFNGSLDAANGTLVFVTTGSANAGVFFRLSATDPVIIETSAIAWTRVGPTLGGESANVLDFGAVGDGVTDDRPAFLAAIASVSENAESVYVGGPKIIVPPGTYYLSDSINLKKTVWIQGCSSGFPAGSATLLNFASGKHGFIINRYNTTNGSTVESPATTGADGTIIEGLDIRSLGGGATTRYAIYAKARFLSRNNLISNFSSGYGIIASSGAGDATEGNANCFRIEGGSCYNNYDHGIFADGADANAGTVFGLDCSGNGGWGVYDSSFLGNSYLACHFATNGVFGRGDGVSTAMVSDGTDRFYVKVGQAVGASTNAPTPGADNTWWGYIGAGGVHATFPLWVSGIATREGGAFRTDNANAQNLFLGNYSEPDQPPAQTVYPTFVLSGSNSAGVEGTSTWLRNLNGAIYSEAPFSSLSPGAVSGTLSTSIGGEGASEGFDLMIHTVKAALGYRTRFFGNDLFLLSYGNITAPIGVSGPLTAQEFGTGAVQTHIPFAPKLALGRDGGAGMRILTCDSAAPTTGAHARGEIVFNNAPSAAGKIGWVCTAAGTPGTWKEWGVIDA